MNNNNNSSAQIQINDLVYVKKTKHKCTDWQLGRFYSVIGFSPKNAACEKCGVIIIDDSMTAIFNYDSTSRPIGLPVSWLRKVPPLSEPETVEKEKELVT